MALIKCPGRDGMVSTKADACPKCGHKITEEDIQKTLNTNKVLTKSPECKEEVSTIAGACSNLDTQEDRQRAARAKPWYKKWWGIASLIIVVSFFILMYWRVSVAKKAEMAEVAAKMAEVAYEEGDSAMMDGDYEKAVESFEKAIALGNPYAKGDLGLAMYAMGNADEGLRLIREAAAEGSPYILADLALNFLLGDDVEEGNKLMLEAYNTGHWYPAFKWAEYYALFAEGERDLDKAEKYLDEAVKRGASEDIVVVLKESILSGREEEVAEQE